jgi:hypothetical protein
LRAGSREIVGPHTLINRTTASGAKPSFRLQKREHADLTSRPGRHIVQGCTIDAGSSLTHGTASPAISCPTNESVPSSFAAGDTYQSATRTAWLGLALDRAGAAGRIPNPLAGPIDRGAGGRLLMSPLTCRADRIYSFPGPSLSNRAGIASQTIREKVLHPRHIARCGDTAHPVCGSARAAASR